MMRKFVHKTLWWIAKENYSCYHINWTEKTWTMHPVPAHIPRELIENSYDREEVVEQSPQRMRDVIEEYNKNYTHLNNHKLIQALEKHAPKEKKFTIEDIRDWQEKYWYVTLYAQWATAFFRDNNLLSEDTEWETCEHESDWWVYITLRKEWEEQKPPQSKCTKCKKFYRN